MSHHNRDTIRKMFSDHVKKTILKMAEEITDLRKREIFTSQVLGKSYDPTPGVSSLDIEVGKDTSPGNSQPIHGGNGIPGGQLPFAQEAGDQNGGVDLACPLCNEDGLECACVRSMGKTELPGRTAQPQKQMQPEEPKQPEAKQVNSQNKTNFGKTDLSTSTKTPNMSVGTGPAPSVGGVQSSVPMAMSEKQPNKDPSKHPDAKLPPEETKEIKSKGSGTVSDPKKGKMEKAAVPAAKPPSGKIPGGTASAPVASNTSKPQVKKEMEKAALTATPEKKQMQSQMLNDSFKAAQAVTPPVAKPSANPVGDQLDALLAGNFGPKNTLSNPNDPARSNMLASFTPSPQQTGMKLPVPAPGRAAVPPVGTAVAPKK